MAGVDAELHLRLAGEQFLIDSRGDDGGVWESPLDAAAHALVAVGALPAATAQAIVDDYVLAQSCRSGEGWQHRRHRRMRAQQAAAAVPGDPGRFRALSCRQLIEQPWGNLLVDYVVLSADATMLHVTMRPSAALGGRFGRISAAALHGGARPHGIAGHMAGAGVPGQLTVTDDRGRPVTAHFSGGGSPTEWAGEFEARPGLALDTGWIEVLGQRIELVDEPGPGIDVWTEPVAEQDPGRRYLLARLAMLLSAHEDAPLDSTIGALIAAGALPPAIPPSRRRGRCCGSTCRAAGVAGPVPAGRGWPSRGGRCWLPAAAGPARTGGSWWARPRRGSTG